MICVVWSVRRIQLSTSRAGNDRYAERAMNTFNDELKNKMTQTQKITHQDACVNATTWDIFDTYCDTRGNSTI